VSEKSYVIEEREWDEAFGHYYDNEADARKNLAKLRSANPDAEYRIRVDTSGTEFLED